MRHLLRNLPMLGWGLLVAAGFLLLYALCLEAQPVCSAYASDRETCGVQYAMMAYLSISP